mmetsp:Transcript_65129/g.174614  ORF Transcript_65129/g.174614 Transcript_65129/m.174614 type:complete len:265 (-) Transcript_65129:95-889(-)
MFSTVGGFVHRSLTGPICSTLDAGLRNASRAPSRISRITDACQPSAYPEPLLWPAPAAEDWEPHEKPVPLESILSAEDAGERRAPPTPAGSVYPAKDDGKPNPSLERSWKTSSWPVAMACNIPTREPTRRVPSTDKSCSPGLSLGPDRCAQSCLTAQIVGGAGVHLIRSGPIHSGSVGFLRVRASMAPSLSSLLSWRRTASLPVQPWNRRRISARSLFSVAVPLTLAISSPILTSNPITEFASGLTSTIVAGTPHRMQNGPIQS